MQLAALAAVISYFWRDVSDLLGSLSAIGRRDFSRGIALTRKGRSETISWQGPLDSEPSGYPTDYSNETDNDNQRADRRQKQPAQKPYHSIR
jgi:hypothetical protein